MELRTCTFPHNYLNFTLSITNTDLWFYTRGTWSSFFFFKEIRCTDSI